MSECPNVRMSVVELVELVELVEFAPTFRSGRGGHHAGVEGGRGAGIAVECSWLLWSFASSSWRRCFVLPRKRRRIIIDFIGVIGIGIGVIGVR